MVQQQPINGNDLGADLAAKMATEMELNFAMRVSKLKGVKHGRVTQPKGKAKKCPRSEKNKRSVLNTQGEEDPQAQICKGKQPR